MSRQEKRVARDPYDDLAGVDLSQINLDDIDVDDDVGESEPSVGWRFVGLLFLLGLGAGLLYLPHSQFYQRYKFANWLFFLISGAGIVIGLLVGRQLFAWAEAAAARWARYRRPDDADPDAPPRPIPGWVRWITLTIAIGAGAFLVLGVPAGQSLSAGRGGGFNLIWFGMVAGALAVGGLIGRWLMMQSQRADNPTEPYKPIQWPSWFKWVTLTVLVVLGIIAAFGLSFMPSQYVEPLRFAFGGVAFVVGLFAAIWLAKRFDETEKKLKARTRDQAGSQRRLPPGP